MKGSLESGIRAALASVILCFASSGLAMAADLVIGNVTVVSPEHSAALPRQNVLIRDGRIVSVTTKPISTAPDAARIDGRGKFLTPGLMDSHVHVSDVPGLPPGANDPLLASLQDAYTRQQPRSYLYYGVTQLLDLSGSADRIQAFEAQPQHPDLYRCGAAVVLDGYPTLFAPEAVRRQLWPDFIYEPANVASHPLPKGADPAQHTPEAVVDRLAAGGAHCIKVFIETGFGGGSHWPIMSKETLQKLRAATRKRGLPLVAHANAIDMQRIAVEAQVDVLAHGVWNWKEYSTNDGVPPAIASHLREVHAKKIGYQPTLRVIAALADLFREDTLKDPAYAKVVPGPLLEWYATPAGQWFKEATRQDMDGAPDMKVMHSFMVIEARGMRTAKYLQELGHPLLLGSDTPSAPTFGSQPGYDTYREMRMMAQSGIPLAAVFQAATINNARQFGLERDYGSVEPGKVANLLLLNANPLETMRAWDSIDRIILHGVVIRRASLVATREQ